MKKDQLAQLSLSDLVYRRVLPVLSNLSSDLPNESRQLCATSPTIRHTFRTLRLKRGSLPMGSSLY